MIAIEALRRYERSIQLADLGILTRRSAYDRFLADLGYTAEESAQIKLVVAA